MDRPSSELATARRALAAALLKPDAPEADAAPPVSQVVAWLFVIWTVAVAASYFALPGWWRIPTE